MFWFLGIGVALSVAIWSVLLGQFGRDKSIISVLFIFSFGFLFLLVAGFIFQFYSFKHATDILHNHGLEIGFAGILLFLSFLFRIYANNFMPVGIVIMISGALWIISIFIYELLFLESFPTPVQIILVSLIMISVISLVWIKNESSIRFKDFSWKGLAGSFMAGACIGTSFGIMTDVSRATTSFILTPLLWLTAMAFGIYVAIAVRGVIRRKFASAFTLPQMAGLSMASLFFVLTGVGFSYAASMGSVTVLAAIESTSIMMTALIAWFFMGEKLVLKQWTAMCLVTACIIALKFV